MTIEAASFINQLDPTRPLAADILSEGDDHIRLAKSVLKSSFPNIGGAANPTHTELNYVVGATSAIQTQLNNLSGSANAAFSQSATYAAGTVGATLQRRISVTDTPYSADPTGVADSLAAFNAAITAATARGSYVVVPPGIYLLSGNVNVTCPIEGLGYGSLIKTTSATANIFTATANYVLLGGLNFDSTVTRTGGWYVDVNSSATRFELDQFWMNGAIGGVRTLSAATSTISRGEIYNCIASTGVAIRVDAGFDVSITDVTTDSASQIFSSCYITNAGDVSISDCQFIHGGNALFVDCGTGKTVTSLWANNSFFDTSTRGVLLSASGGNIARSLFDQCWMSSATLQGVALQTSSSGTINGTDLNACHVFLNGSDGVSVIDTGVKNTQVNACAIAQNTGSGFSAAANVTDFAVMNSRIGNTHGLTANGYGVLVAAGTSNRYRIIGNDLLGNTTANLQDGGSGTSKVVANNITV